jgi:hypothetical protein
MENLPEQCCNLPPFKAEYEPVGERVKVEAEGKDFEVYVTGPKDSKYVLVGIHGKYELKQVYYVTLMK